MNKHVIRTPRTRCQCGNTNLAPTIVHTCADVSAVPMLYCSECYSTLTTEIVTVTDKPKPEPQPEPQPEPKKKTRKVQHICPECNGVFYGYRAQMRVYCSNACRNRARRYREDTATYRRCMCCGKRKYISKDKVWCADCAQMLRVEA